MTKQTKIIIYVVLSCTILLLLFIPSFADYSPTPSSDDTVLIKAGTYRWNDEIVGLDSFPNYSVNIPILFTSSPIVTIDGNDVTVSNGTQLFTGIALNYSILTPITSIQYVITENEGLPVYVGNDESNNRFWKWNGLYEAFTMFGASVSTDLKGYGQTITILEDTYVPSDFGNWANSNWTRLDDYEGNPFLDIINLVVEALDVPIFGTFSLWDMLTTLCGLFAVVWLLKLLAGG